MDSRLMFKISYISDLRTNEQEFEFIINQCLIELDTNGDGKISKSNSIKFLSIFQYTR